MDYKKTKASASAISRDFVALQNKTGNIYKTVSALSKRANQLSVTLKDELTGKLEEFATHTDSLEEVFENREQIEISKYYEKLPKPSLVAIDELLNDNIYMREIPKENK